MLPLRPNPETGYLETNGASAFDSARKVRFLELAKQVRQAGGWPNVQKLCESVGISYTTFKAHMAMDAPFKSAWTEVTMSAASQLESTMFEHAQRPGNYMDRITWLRANMPEKWNPDLKVNISSDSDQVKGLLDGASKVIEADIVPNSPQLIEKHGDDATTLQP